MAKSVFSENNTSLCCFLYCAIGNFFIAVMICVYVKSKFLLLKVDICVTHHAHCKHLDTLLIWGYMYISYV